MKHAEDIQLDALPGVKSCSGCMAHRHWHKHRQHNIAHITVTVV